MTSSTSSSERGDRGRPRWPGGLLAAAGAVLAIEAVVASAPFSVEKDLVRNRYLKREPALKERQQRLWQRKPAASGVLALMVYLTFAMTLYLLPPGLR